MSKTINKLAGICFIVFGIFLLPKFSLAAEGPEIISPMNGSIITSTNFIQVDWKDSTEGSGPSQYQYEIFSDANYTNSLSLSEWLPLSEISTASTLEGEYYVRVRARDTSGAMTDWSNGAGNPHKIIVDNTPENFAPELNLISSNETIPELSLHTFTATATDVNFADPMTFTLSTDAPRGATIHPTLGVFIWTPEADQGTREYTFEVMVWDGELSDSQQITINVTNS